MVIEWNGTALTVKRRPEDVSQVRLGIGLVQFWVAHKATKRSVLHLKMEKPHADHTVGELTALLEQLERLKREMGVEN